MENKQLLEVYEKLQILHSGGLTNVIEYSDYSEYILQIKANLSTTNYSLIIKIMQVLLDNDLFSIREDVISILSDSNVDVQFKKDLLESQCFEGLLRQSVKSGDLEGLVQLSEVLEKVDVVQVMPLFTETLETICKSDEVALQCKNLIYKTLVPKILKQPTHNVVELNMAMCFALALPVTTLTEEEYKSFSEKMDEYIKTISDLRENNYEHWHIMWMFLIRLLGKKLHQSMNLMNKLLRVVESAFRNQFFEQRLKGYDCWKELIDNEYLDPQHLTSDKQIKLILTPLRAKFSRQESVVLKKFEVFCYLMDRLQDKAFLVFKEFVEFTFGVIGVNTDPHKSGFAKTIPELRQRSAAVFMALLGHSHDTTCLETSEVNFVTPPLTRDTVFRLYQHVINSAGEVCRLMRDKGVVRCMWKSLFKLVLGHNHEEKDNALKLIGKVFLSFLQNGDVFYKNVAMVIFMEAVEVGDEKCMQVLFERFDVVLKVLFTVALDVEGSNQMATLIPLLQPTHTPQILEAFSKYKTLEHNVDYIDDLWLYSAKNCKTEDISKTDFYLWPVLHGQFLHPAKLDNLFETLASLVNSNDDLHGKLLKELDISMKNCPLLGKLVMKLMDYLQFKQQDLTLDLVSQALAVSDDTANSASSLIRKWLQLKLQQPEVVLKISQILQQLLQLKCYEFIDVFEADDLRQLYAKHLTSDFLSSLEQTSEVQKLAKLLHKKDITNLMLMGGRAAKIANLVKKIPQSPQKTLRLFGKDIETHSPIKCVGSQLKRNSSSKATPPKKKPEPPVIDDESNSKFVLIDSEVKVDKNNLTEHQKETFNKRDQDIPALYQDLSQSQTIDSFKKPVEVNEEEKKKEEAKRLRELKKLAMNIVGADEFVLSSNKRKRREKKSEEVEVKLKTDEHENKRNNSPEVKPVAEIETVTPKLRRSSQKVKSPKSETQPKKQRKPRKSLPNMKLETQSEIFHVTADAELVDHISEAIEDVVKKAYENDDEDEDIVASSQEVTNSRLRLSMSKTTPKRRTRSKTPPLPETETQSEGVDLKCEVDLQFELPQNKVLTDSEKELARMDTASLPMVELSFNSEKQDTIVENRTLVSKEEAEKENVENEAYDDTDEVLEINGVTEEEVLNDLPASPINENTPNKTNELLNDTMDISPIRSKPEEESERRLVPVALKFDNEEQEVDVKQKSPEKADDAPEKSPEKELEIAAVGTVEKVDAKPDIVEKQEKSLLKMGSPATHQRLLLRKNKGLNMSPSASRIKKLMSNVKPPSQTEPTDELTEDNLLTFSREVPSPLAIPKSSILKRKHPDTSDEPSPVAKRKRVNFSDPCTTSQKVFLKEDGGFPMSGKEEEDLDKQFLEVLSEAGDSERMEVTVKHTSDPIYPALMDCDDNVSVISRKLTSPMFVKAFISKLDGCNIKTIGDLAKLSRVDIRRLPFKNPLDDSVFKALDVYHQDKCKLNGNIQGEHNYSDPTPDPSELEKLSVDTIVQHLFDKCDRREVVDSFLSRVTRSDIGRLFDEMSVDKLRLCGAAFFAQMLD